jgi:4-oxalomesaconate tautomerase
VEAAALGVYTAADDATNVLSAALLRTARLIMRGEVMVASHLGAH